MKTPEIRDRFLKFFAGKNHTVIPSSSLIPQNDPTLLFANAGMNQFKDYFTGKATPAFSRAVTVQKCVRAGGKHNDLENVGFTARHHTFFEMLGNFSFGNYFKKEAISYAWEFLTVDLKIPKEKLYITVHHSDDEALALWKDMIGIPVEKIFKKDEDNFWEMGEFGPCGPCSEIFYDHGPAYTDPNYTPKPGGDLLDDTSRYVEIWNLVFMQFEKTPQGTSPLPSPCIDTGAGLERLAAALQGTFWNYDTDLFRPILDQLEKITGKKYSNDQWKSHMRVVADHIRSSTMLLTDGVIPSNEGRGYVLRRIIRRAIRHMRELGAREVSFYKLVPAVFQTLGQAYPMNAQNISLAERFLEMEEKKFLETLDQGLKFLQEALKEGVSAGTFPGELAFKLYDTYGFPLDLTETILREKNMRVDLAGFEKSMQEQKEKSKKSWKGADLQKDRKIFWDLLQKHGPSTFTGYSGTQQESTLLEIHPLDDEARGGGGPGLLIFKATPFYGESGGQVGDKGDILFQGQTVAQIEDTQIPVEGLIVHLCQDTGNLVTGQNYTLRVHQRNRDLTARNHSATHLLQSALITVLGPHVKQAGSIVTPDRLRFDFTHMKAMSKEEIHRVEDLVNEQIQRNLSVVPTVMNKEAALKKGVMALFNEKYGEEVRVIEMGDFSRELCGGTHVRNTGEIEHFSIVSESSLASGVRRIEGITSTASLTRIRERSLLLEQIEQSLKVATSMVLGQIENFKKEIRDLQRENETLKDKIRGMEGAALFASPEIIKDSYQFKMVEVESGSDLKKLSDLFMDKFPEGKAIILLYMKLPDKISFLLRAHRAILALDCSEILSESLKKVGGKGGGRKELAQGSGGREINLPTFLNEVKDAIRERL